MSNSIKTTFSAVTCEIIRDGFSKSNSAQLRQKVTSTYPAAKGNTSHSDGLYSDSEFGANGNVYTSSRVAFLKVPKGLTVPQVQAELDKHVDARLYRIMSLDFKKIMTTEQKIAIENGISSLSYNDYEEKLRARNPQSNEDIPFNDVVFYRGVFFSKTAKEDVDTRASEYAAVNQETFNVAERVSLTDEAPEVKKVIKINEF